MKEVTEVLPATFDQIPLVQNAIMAQGEGNVRPIKETTLERLIESGSFWIGYDQDKMVGTLMGIQRVESSFKLDVHEVRSVIVTEPFRGNGAVPKTFEVAVSKYQSNYLCGVTLNTAVAMHKGFIKLGFREANDIEIVGIFGLPHNRKRNLENRIVWVKDPN